MAACSTCSQEWRNGYKFFGILSFLLYNKKPSGWRGKFSPKNPSYAEAVVVVLKILLSFIVSIIALKY